MLKGQDVVLLAKFIANEDSQNWNRGELMRNTGLTASTLSKSLDRLRQIGLITDMYKVKNHPIAFKAEELFISAVKYFFPAEITDFTNGIPTCYASPIFKLKLVTGDGPHPVWPYVLGEEKGMALVPLHKNLPHTITANPDEDFYNLLTAIDVLRWSQSRARERNMAIDFIINLTR